MNGTEVSAERGPALRSALALAGLLVALCLTGSQTPAVQVGEETSVASRIVQARDLETARAAVESVGGTITHELGIIHAVAAELTADQSEALDNSPYELTASQNSAVETAGWVGGDLIYVDFPKLVGADLLHEEGIDGFGQTVAIVDSGFMYTAELQRRTRRDDHRGTGQRPVRHHGGSDDRQLHVR